MNSPGVLLIVVLSLSRSSAGLTKPGLLGQTLDAQSLYFLYQGEVVLTKSTWLVSFSLDMEPYKNQVTEIVAKVNELNDVLQSIDTGFDSSMDGEEQDQEPANLTAADKAYQKNMELFKMEGAASKKEATSLQQLYSELEESFLLPRSVAWSSYIENKPKLPGRTRSRRSLLSLVGFLTGGVVDIATLVSVKQLKSRVKVLSDNVDDLMHATRDSFSILNVTQEQVHQNRVALNKLGEDIAAATQQMQLAFTQLEQRTLKELHYMMVNSEIHSYFNVVQNALRRAFTQLVMLREDLNSAALGRMNFGMVSREQLRMTIKKIQNLLPQGYFIPVDEHNLGPLYKHGGVVVFAINQVLYTTMAIPVARVSTEFDVYKLVSVPHLREDLGVSLKYKLEETGLAISKDRMTYQLMTAAEATLCGNPATPFCILSRAKYSVRRNPSCLSSLFMKDQANLDRLCEVTRNTGPENVFAEYLFEGTWLVSTHQDLAFSQVCNPEADEMNPEAGVIRISRGTNLVKIKKGCRATSDVLSLPTYFSRSSSEQLKDRFQKEFTNMKRIQLFSNKSTYYGKSGGLPTIQYSRLPEGEKAGRSTLESWINHFKQPTNRQISDSSSILLTLSLVLAIGSTLCWISLLIWGKVYKKSERRAKTTCKSQQTTHHAEYSQGPATRKRRLPTIPIEAGVRLGQEHFRANVIYVPYPERAQATNTGHNQHGSSGTIYDFIGMSNADNDTNYEPFEHNYSKNAELPGLVLPTIPECTGVDSATRPTMDSLPTETSHGKAITALESGPIGSNHLEAALTVTNQAVMAGTSAAGVPGEVTITTQELYNLKRNGSQPTPPTQLYPKRRCLEAVSVLPTSSQENLEGTHHYEESLC